MSKGTKKVFRNGKWEDGSASPELRPEDMRGMPDDFVTKDEGDPDRVHKLDPPHIKRAVAHDRAKSMLIEEKKEPITY